MKNNIIILACLVLLNACSQFVPFEDRRREAGQLPTVGMSSDKVPVICYNPLWHDLKDTQELADAACLRTKKKAVYSHSDTFSCRLINPSAAFYTCK